jgi:hypothetical protein
MTLLVIFLHLLFVTAEVGPWEGWNVNPLEIPLFTPGQPRMQDINRTSTPNYWLESTLVAIADAEPKVITSMLHDDNNGSVTVKLYDWWLDASQTVEKQIPSESFQHCVWFQVIQDAFNRFLKEANMTAPFFPDLALGAIYNSPTVTVYCDQLGYAIQDQSGPVVICTNSTEGQLLDNHCYTVLGGLYAKDPSSITLRNPNENEWGSAATGGKNITNLGDGILRVPTSIALKQCDRVYSMLYSNPSRR